MRRVECGAEVKAIEVYRAFISYGHAADARLARAELDASRLVGTVCAVVQRNLTCEEWIRHVGDR